MPQNTRRQISEEARARIISALFDRPGGKWTTQTALVEELGLTKRQVQRVSDAEHKRRGTRPTRKKPRQTMTKKPNLAKGHKRAIWEMRDQVRGGVAELIWGNVEVLQKQLERNQQRDDVTASDAQKLASALSSLMDMLEKLEADVGGGQPVAAGGKAARKRDLRDCPAAAKKNYREAAKLLRAADEMWDVAWVPA